MNFHHIKGYGKSFVAWRESQDRLVLAFLAVSVCLCFVVNWMPIFGRDSWCDELITIWVIKDGFNDVISRALQFQGSSPLYFLVAWVVSHSVDLTPETSLRILSALCTAVATLYIYRLSRCFTDRETGLISCYFFQLLCCLRYGEAYTGRPYALGVMFVFISLDSFTRLVLFNDRRQMAALFVSSVAIPYIHPFFNLIFLVHALIGVLYWKELRPHFKSLIKLTILMAVLVAPNIYQLGLLGEKHDLYTFRNTLTLNVVAIYIALSEIVYGCLLPILGIWIIYAIRYRQLSVMRSLNVRGLVIASAIALFGCVILSAYSLLRDASHFVPRYAIYSLGGWAILLGLLNATIPLRAARLLVCYCFTVVVFNYGVRWMVVDSLPSAIHAMQKLRAPSDLVLVEPCLLEQKEESWVKDKEKRNYLLAVATHYDTDTQFMVYPWETASAANMAKRDLNSKQTRTNVWIIQRDKACSSYDSIERKLAEVGLKIAEEIPVENSVRLLKCEVM